MSYETFRESEIVCPYCGSAPIDSREVVPLSDGEVTEFECESCGKVMRVTVNIDITFTTVPVEDK